MAAPVVDPTVTVDFEGAPRSVFERGILRLQLKEQQQ